METGEAINFNDQVEQSERLYSDGDDKDDDESNSRSNPEQNETEASKSLQKINYLSSYVCFKEDLEQTRVRVWTRLKEKMCSVMLAQGLDLVEWIYTLEEYINAFEFAFTKQEHILMVKMCWTVLMQMEHDFDLMNKLVNLTALLLSKPSLLTREDLQLDWRPLNCLFQRLFYSCSSVNMLASVPSTLNKNLRKLAHKSSFYYSKESTSEILAEWLHLLSPYSSKYSRYIGLIALFVPVHLPPEEHQFGFKLWLDDLMKIFTELPKQDHSVLVKMFSGLAKSAFGFIDWEPYMAVIFQYFQWKFISKTVSNDLILDSVRWIVYMITPTSSSCLANLEQLLQIFFTKRKTIVCSLMSEFIGRLRTEMASYKYWYECSTPESCFLTNDLISQFGCLMVKHFEKINFCDFEFDHLYNLCLIAPVELARQSVDKFALAEARIFEPNRLKLALQMYSVSLFPLVVDEQVGAQHRTTVISTLTKLTKSINTNDQTLAFLHLLTIRSIVVLGIPLEDCSMLNTTGLDEHSTQIVKDSIQLEQFPSDFVQLCFTILECNNDRLFIMKQQGLSLGTVLFDILLHVLTNVSQEKCETICDQIVSYCTTSIIESAQCCDLLKKLLTACLLTDHSGRVFNKLFISISNNLLSSMEDHTKYSDICQSEFIYNWRMLHVCFGFNGKVLVPHQDAIVRLLKRIYEIEFDANFEHNNMITEILSYLFYILACIYSLSRVYNGRQSKEADDNKRKQLTQFPVQYMLAELPLEWHVPNGDEIAFAKNLFVQFIKPEMSSLEEWATTDQAQLTTAQLEKSLGIVLSFLGCRKCLPPAGDSIIKNYFSDLSDSLEIDLFDGENFRENIILLMGKILEKLKASPSDNVKLIKIIVETIDHSLFPYANTRTVRIKGRKFKRSNVFHPLTSRYTSLPIVKYNKVSAYHSKMSTILKRWTNHKFTSCHQLATFQLLDLSTCSNTILRDRAQRILCKLIKLFRAKVVELILPRLLENLRNVSQHDAFIGTLDLLTKRTTFRSILIASEWPQLTQLWPSLVEVNSAEKPKIVNLIDSNVLHLFKEGVYVTMPIERKKLSSTVGMLLQEANKLNFSVPSSEDIEQIEQSIEEKVNTDRFAYEDLVNRLTALLAPKTLHWRFYKLGFIMLQFLIQYDHPDYSIEAVKFTLENVIHDLDSIRQWAIWGIKKILLFIKPTKVLYRAEEVEQFDPKTSMDCLHSKEIYERTQFNDKTDYGFSDEIALVCSKFVPKKELSKYQFIADKFCDETFLDQFFKLHSVENLKKLTRNVNLTKMFKHLFSTFGLLKSEAFFTRIEALLQKKKHNYDKCALEILWAMVRSAPRLDYDHLLALKHFLDSILFEKYFTTKCYNRESFEYWYCLFVAMFTHRDLRRFYWVFERFFNDRLFGESRSTLNQATVFGLIGIGLDANWKYEHVSEMVLSRLEQNMAQKYEIMRTIMSVNIMKVFHYRIQLPSPSKTTEFIVRSKPSRIDFIQRLYDRLYQALSPLLVVSSSGTSSNRITCIKSGIFNFDNETGRELYNLIDTICMWIRCSLADSKLIASGEFGILFPLLSVVQTNKPELQVNVHQAITAINTQKYSQSKDVQSILPQLELVSRNWNWHSRKLVATFVHNLLYNNLLFIVQSNSELIDKLSSLILRMLSNDEAIEVRNTAMIVVRDLIKWNVIGEEKMIDLVNQWKANSLEKTNNNSLVVRHGAILGLCAFVYAYSYEMNNQLVDIVLFLAKRLSDPEPIRKTISQALRSFKTTHEPNWIEHKKQFTDEQLIELSNTLVSLSCFA